jgi:hypothetical protein
MFMDVRNITIPQLNEKENEYFLIQSGLMYQALPHCVKQEMREWDDLKLKGWLELVSQQIAIRRIFDVRTPRQVEELEETARKPKGYTEGQLRDWWTVAQTARELGYVSWKHIGAGLTRLCDDWEKRGVLLPREQRRLSDLVHEYGLDEFRVSEQGVRNFIARMMKLVRSTSAAPVKAHAASAWPGEGEEYTVVDPADAFFGKTKGPGKGAPGKAGDGCFNCGGKDHWARECPKPRPKGFGDGKGKSKGGKSKSAHWAAQHEWEWPDEQTWAKMQESAEPLHFMHGDNPQYQNEPTGLVSHQTDDQRTATGACWKCGSTLHHKHQCPEWQKQQGKAAAAAAQPQPKKKGKPKFRAKFVQAMMAALESLDLDEDDDSGLGNQRSPPSPNP